MLTIYLTFQQLNDWPQLNYYVYICYIQKVVQSIPKQIDGYKGSHQFDAFQADNQVSDSSDLYSRDRRPIGDRLRYEEFRFGLNLLIFFLPFYRLRHLIFSNQTTFKIMHLYFTI